MSTLRQAATDLGFPELGATPAAGTMPGRFTAWIPGMKTDIADWFLVNYHGGDVRRYLEGGGNPDRLIIHFLGFDEGLIDPLWDRDKFWARTMRMKKEWGVSHLISPDFSSWGTWPAIVQLHNYYKSAVVTADFIKAGFNVIPNICWSSPKTYDVSIGLWGDRDFALFDLNHWAHSRRDMLSLRRGLEVVRSKLDLREVLIYTTSKKPAAEAVAIFGKERCRIVPARAKMLNHLVRTIDRREKAQQSTADLATEEASDG